MTSTNQPAETDGGRSLDSIQEWMQAVIVDPDGVVEGATANGANGALATDTTSATIEEMILPSNALTSRQRIEVYGNAYYARLLECLSDEYPALSALLGEETFNAFAFEYLQQHPSESYTLADLGQNFPEYLAENRAAATDDEDDENLPDAAHASWIDLMIDLAVVERTYAEIFSGPGNEKSETLNADAVAAIPPDQVGAMRLQSSPCVRLIRLNTRAHEFAIAVRKGTASIDQLPEAVPAFLIVTRINYVVRTIAVAPDEFRLLEQLISGVSLEEAIEFVSEDSAMDDEQWTVHLAEWFQKWATHRLFAGICND